MGLLHYTIGKTRKNRFRLIATLLSMIMFIEQPLWALSNAKYLEIKKNVESLELIKHDMSVGEFLKKDGRFLPYVIKKPMEWVSVLHPEVSLSKITVTKIPAARKTSTLKGAKEEFDIQLQMNFLGTPVVMTFVEEGDVVAKINGQQITRSDVDQVFPYMKKIAKALEFNQADTYLKAVPTEEGLKNIESIKSSSSESTRKATGSRSPASSSTKIAVKSQPQKSKTGPLVPYDVFVKMNKSQQIKYIKNVRLLLESMEEVGLARAKVINQESKSHTKSKKTSAIDNENTLTPWQSSPFFQIWIAGLNEAIAAGKETDYSNESCLVAGRLSAYGKGNDGRWSCGANDERIKSSACDGSGGIVCDTTFFASANSDLKVCVGPDRGGTSSATAQCAKQAPADATLAGLLKGIKGGVGQKTKDDFDTVQTQISSHYSLLIAVCNGGNVIDKSIFKQHPGLKDDQQKACKNFRERYEALKKDCESFAQTKVGKDTGLTCTDAPEKPPVVVPPPAESEENCNSAFQAFIQTSKTGALPLDGNGKCAQGTTAGPKQWKLDSIPNCQRNYCDNANASEDPNVSACVADMNKRGAKTAAQKEQLNCGDSKKIAFAPGSPCGNVDYHLCLCKPGVYKTSCSGNDSNDSNNGGNSGEKEEGWFSRFFSGIGDWFSNNWKDILKWTVIAGVGFAALKGMNSAYKRSLDQRYKNNSQDTPKTTDSSQDNSHLPPPVK